MVRIAAWIKLKRRDFIGCQFKTEQVQNHLVIRVVSDQVRTLSPGQKTRSRPR